MPLTLTYKYHGILCPQLDLTPKEAEKLPDKYKTTLHKKTFDINFFELIDRLYLIPHNNYIGEITPENFREVLTDLVTDQVISEETKQQYDSEFTAQYQILSRIGEDPANYDSALNQADFETYHFRQPKAAKEIIFLEKQINEFSANKIIKKDINDWLMDFKKIALLEAIYLASGSPSKETVLTAAKINAMDVEKNSNKFAPGESLLTDWLHTAINSDGPPLTQEELATLNDFLQNNPVFFPIFRAIALWAIFGIDSRLDNPVIVAERRQLDFILFGNKKITEKLSSLAGAYNRGHTIYLKYDKKPTEIIATLIHEIMHAAVNLIHDEDSSIPEKTTKDKPSWKEIATDSLQRIIAITPRPETKKVLKMLDFSQYSQLHWLGELISRTSEVKYSNPNLEILLNKTSGAALREELNNLSQQADAWVKNFHMEAGLSLIHDFETDFFPSVEPIKLNIFESELLKEAFQNKQTILDCFINKKLVDILPQTLITYLHQDRNISENAILLSAARNGHLEMVETLFSQFKFDFKQQTVIKAFNLAVKNNHIDIVKLFIKQNIDINCHYEQKLSPLHYAAAFGHTDLAQLLVQQGANVNAPDRDGNSVLHWAAQEGNLELVKYFIQCSSALVTQKNQKGETALHLAAHNGHFEIVKYLLSQDNSLATEPTLGGNTPLHLACSKGRTDIMQLLLAHKININAVNNFDETPLYLAVKNQQGEAVALLLQANGLNTSIASKNSLTPLHLAVASEQVAITLMLLNFSTYELQFSNCAGDTPLHLAAKIGATSICANLLYYGADPNLKNDQKASPLHLAVINGSEEVVSRLLKANAFINAENYYGVTPLHLAVIYQKNHLLDLLLANPKIDINASDEANNTALHFAVLYENAEAVKILIKSPKIDLTACNTDGQTPLELAEKNEKTKEIAELLKNNINTSTVNTQSSLQTNPSVLNSIYSLVSNFGSKKPQKEEAANIDDLHEMTRTL